jgi:hypothetical protein
MLTSGLAGVLCSCRVLWYRTGAAVPIGTGAAVLKSALLRVVDLYLCCVVLQVPRLVLQGDPPVTRGHGGGEETALLFPLFNENFVQEIIVCLACLCAAAAGQEIYAEMTLPSCSLMFTQSTACCCSSLTS